MRSLWAVCLLAAAPVWAAEPERVEKPAAETAEFKPPPGFRAKRRGDLTLYCRREDVLGSRFKAEKCYDEAGIRQLRLADLEKTEMLERIRACGSASCSAN